ncbi:hypothetical protein GOP47_0003376 [Adiantum capillus-veneris]|uniref:Uncharacterized protein n=1 Tax=Adiantum capillus-veneris TaxID=13818 RepID=A0A9D4ZQ31_ADICA|nr:hypothetical protein GOP47_0003376 [Adiantum capillus-veneris]
MATQILRVYTMVQESGAFYNRNQVMYANFASMEENKYLFEKVCVKNKNESNSVTALETQQPIQATIAIGSSDSLETTSSNCPLSLVKIMNAHPPIIKCTSKIAYLFAQQKIEVNVDT